MKKSFPFKKGELVQLIAGKHKGKTGSIQSMNVKAQTLILEGLNLKTKHVKADPVKKTPGCTLSLEFPIHRSNVSKLQPERK